MLFHFSNKALGRFESREIVCFNNQCMAERKENVFLRGFGTFTVKHRAQKTARNISKNTTLVIEAHDFPAFKPAKSFIAKMK